MYLTSRTPIKATENVVIPRVYSLIMDWYTLGYRDMDLSYTDVFRSVLPLNGMGTTQARMIGDACQMFEETTGESLDVILPNLRAARRRGDWHSEVA